jgi:hypothetical protein
MPVAEAAMDFKGFVEKAKGAAAAAGDIAKEVAVAASEQAKSAMAAPVPATEGGEAADQGPEGATPPGTTELKSVAEITSEALASLKDIGATKVQELVVSFQQALPAIRTAGYELTEFEIELGVTPKLIPHFRYAPRSAEDVASAREAVRDNKLGALMLNALLKAGDVHRQIRVAGYSFSHVEIELGLIPSVRLQYKNDSQDLHLLEPAVAPPLLTSAQSDPAPPP